MAEEKPLNIYQKLAQVRKRVEVVRKNKEGFNYKYVTDDELLAKISGAMDKLGLSLIPTIVPGTFHMVPNDYAKTKLNRKTNEPYNENVHELIVSADMVFKWVNNENPEEIVEIPWMMVGQQSDSSQSFGSALTYAYRYFLLKYFGVATPDDDPDAWRTKQRETEMAEDRQLASSIIATVDDSIKAYLKTNPKEAAKVKALVEKYTADGNYFSIQESSMAGKLLEDFNNTFKKGE